MESDEATAALFRMLAADYFALAESRGAKAADSAGVG